MRFGQRVEAETMKHFYKYNASQQPDIEKLINQLYETCTRIENKNDLEDFANG